MERYQLERSLRLRLEQCEARHTGEADAVQSAQMPERDPPGGHP